MSDDVQAFQESRGRSFTDMWPVAEDYRVAADGLLVPLFNGSPIDHLALGYGDGPERYHARCYLPMAQLALPAEFATVASGRSDDLLRFARRYGLLGYAQAFRFPLEVLGAVRSGVHTANQPGDPVAWITAHASAVKLLGDLARALNEPNALAVLIEQQTVRGAGGEEVLMFQVPTRGYTRPSQLEMRPFATPRAAALHIMAHVLNANLDGVSRYLLVEPHAPGPLGLTSLFTPRNLLDCVYWLLADGVIGGRVRGCLGCGRFFVATHDRMKFCPPPMGLVGVSRCMNRYKQRQFRESKTRRKKTARRPRRRR